MAPSHKLAKLLDFDSYYQFRKKIISACKKLKERVKECVKQKSSKLINSHFLLQPAAKKGQVHYTK